MVPLTPLQGAPSSCSAPTQQAPRKNKVVYGRAVTGPRVNGVVSTDEEVAPGYELDQLLEGISSAVTSEERQSLKDLLEEYRDIFSKNGEDLGETHLGVHTIDTGDARPIRQALRRHPRQMLEEIDTQVKKLEEAGVIEASTSPWAFNLVMVRKSDGTYRMCVDLRGLNSVTKKDAYPLPRIDACLDALAGSRFYSTFDLTSGYFQVPLDPVDAEKTSFLTRMGSFKFKRMTMGLCNAGSTFSRIMQLAMQGLNLQICICYLDDVIVFASSVTSHIQRLRAVFERLRAANLKLKPTKCHLVREEVAFLGHRVSGEGVATDPSKTEAVREWPRPRNIHEVRSFVGLCAYYRRFVVGFAGICAPLHQLTGKHAHFDWTMECEAAFEALKEALTSAPVLAMATDDDSFVLDVDASDRCIGAVLSQVQGGEERVVAYGSRVLSRTERNYCCTRRELLAVVFFVRYFKAYLLGKKFLIRTDHAALTWLRKTPEPIGQQARWVEILEEYDFNIQHRPGRAHGNADALSRIPCRQCGWGKEEEGTGVEARAIHFDVAADTPDSPWSPTRIAEETLKDPILAEVLRWKQKQVTAPTPEEIAGTGREVKVYLSQWDRIHVRTGCLYRAWWSAEGVVESWQLIPPVSRRREIMEIAHAGFGGGHEGVKKSKGKVQKTAWWVDWTRDVEVYCRGCEPCARYFRGTPGHQGTMQHSPVGLPWEKLAIDITGPFPRSKSGYMYMFTVLDCFSKYAFAFPVRNHEGPTLARILIDRVFAEFGIPRQLLSDLGPELQGTLMTEVCRVLEIDKLRSTGYRPQTNGQLERFHRTLNSLLGKVVSEHQRDWEDHVNPALAAYRATVHESTGFTPNFLMFGREVNLPLDLAYGIDPAEGQAFDSYDLFVSDQQDRLRGAFALAREALGRATARNKKTYNLRSRPQEFGVGTWVWVYNPRRYTGRCPKWQRLYTGPYLVVQRLGMVNLVVQKSRRSKRFVTHVDKLKRCLSATPASWVTAEGLEIEEREGAVEPRVERTDEGGPRRAGPRARRPDPRGLQERQENEEMVGPVLIETVGLRRRVWTWGCLWDR